ncbi:MAG: hypothetical protein KatS3mg089_1018 [Patescibacteria group bacterium]|nr:MAG: hypothetical protein KatS3mg089_1018 [Patescibacteria group bacterium]
MDFTTKTIIKILPFEREFKEQLLLAFDTMDPDRKITVERAVWDLYDAIYELKLQENINIALQNALVNKEKLDSEFYKRVKKKTEMELLSSTATTVMQSDLTQAREKLEQLLQEKQTDTDS